MRHDISTTAAHTGHGASVGNQARAIHARHAQAADAILSFPLYRFADRNAVRPAWQCINNEASGLWLTTGRQPRWSKLHDNAYAYRRASPGGNPGRSRNRKPD